MRLFGTPNGDRGALPIALLVAIGIFVAGATAAGVIIVRENHGDNPGGFSLSVVETSASRDAFDLPIATIRYRVDLQSDAAGAALQSALVVHCTIKQSQFTRDRTFSGEAEAFQSTRFIEGALVIKPGEDNKSIQGAYKVNCELRRDGRLLDSAAGDTVTIPPPSGRQTVDITDLAGVYQVTLARTSGSTTDCVVDGTRRVNVLATTSTSLKVSWDILVVYDGPLDETLTFKGDVAITPGFTDYFGPLQAHFDRTSSPTSLIGEIQTSEPACTFAFNGFRADA